MRKGYVLAEVLLGIVVMAGVLVAMSELLAGSLLSTTKAAERSNALLDAYTVAQWVALERKPSVPPSSALSNVNPIVERDAGAKDLKLNLYRSGSKVKEIELVPYNVGAKVGSGDKETMRLLKVYRGEDDDE